MFCSNCGKQIDNAAKFCRFCGTKQEPELSEKLVDATYMGVLKKTVEELIVNFMIDALERSQQTGFMARDSEDFAALVLERMNRIREPDDFKGLATELSKRWSVFAITAIQIHQIVNKTKEDMQQRP